MIHGYDGRSGFIEKLGFGVVFNEKSIEVKQKNKDFNANYALVTSKAS